MDIAWGAEMACSGPGRMFFICYTWMYQLCRNWALYLFHLHSQVIRKVQRK